MVNPTAAAPLDTFSLESFQRTLLTHGREALGANFTWSATQELASYFARRPEALLESPAPKALLRQSQANPARFEEACLHWLGDLSQDDIQELLLDEITRALFERMAEQPPEQPLLEQIEQLSRWALEQGWSQDLGEVFDRIEAYLRSLRKQSDDMQVVPGEWTFESAVGDALLQTAFCLLEEGLADLIEALESGDKRGAKTSLEWLEEGFLTMSGVKEWAAKPWI